MRIRKYVPVKPAGGFPDHESFTVKESKIKKWRVFQIDRPTIHACASISLQASPISWRNVCHRGCSAVIFHPQGEKLRNKVKVNSCFLQCPDYLLALSFHI